MLQQANVMNIYKKKTSLSDVTKAKPELLDSGWSSKPLSIWSTCGFFVFFFLSVQHDKRCAESTVKQSADHVHSVLVVG